MSQPVIYKQLRYIAGLIVLFFVYSSLFDFIMPYYIKEIAVTPYPIDTATMHMHFFDAGYVFGAKYAGYNHAHYYASFAILDLFFPLLYTMMFLTLNKLLPGKNIRRFSRFIIIAGCIFDYLENFSFAFYLQLNSLNISWLVAFFTTIKSFLFAFNILFFFAGLLYLLYSCGLILLFLRYLSQLFKSLWLFFPGLLFLFFPIFCFWMMGQGKDLLVAFVSNELRTYSNGISFNYTRLIFFIAIGFWVYVSWYSSRVISYIKKTSQQLQMENMANVDRNVSELAFTQNNEYFEIGEKFLDEFPRMIGHGCFLVLELAVLQSPILGSPISPTVGWISFFAFIFILRYLDKWIAKTQAYKRSFRKMFELVSISFLIAAVGICFFAKMGLWILFIMLLWLHIVYIYYINLRRVIMEETASKLTITKGNDRNLLEKLMDYFCVPRKEIGYFRWFLFICSIGIVFYFIAILWLWFSRALGPFAFLFLAFAVLLAYGNLVTAFSVRYRLNFHFLLLITAFLLGSKETHEVRSFKLKSADNHYRHRPTLEKYLNAWLDKRMDTGTARYDMYFVMSNGGASRSGYWTAAVLGRLQDSTLETTGENFADHLFCLSGTSGGGVGVASFFSLLRNKQADNKPLYDSSARNFLKKDYFSYTVARMLGPDYFNYIFHLPLFEDRAGALETSFEKSASVRDSFLYRLPFEDDFSNFPAMVSDTAFLPILFINTTRMQDGNPAVVTNLLLDERTFNKRIDVVNLLGNDSDISITTASILGARFPYLSPAGRIRNDYFVDGGYFDNSGAGVVQETIRGIINIGKYNSKLRQKINRINFKVLHIVNSPVGFDQATKEVLPIKNDLMSPIITIMGAYDMQTTVNDQRLINYINDIANANPGNKTSYTPISLYLSPDEWKNDKLYKHCADCTEPGYAMNWFMSDTTWKRIDRRLRTNDTIKKLINEINKTEQ